MITSSKAESDLLGLISKQDVWSICGGIPDLLMNYDVVALVLFGSRARGDHLMDSDIDIAVIVRGCSPWSGHSMRLAREFSGIVYPIELETGLSTSLLPVPIEYMRDPALSGKPDLYENIMSDGLIFWELGDVVDPPARWLRPS